MPAVQRSQSMHVNPVSVDDANCADTSKCTALLCSIWRYDSNVEYIDHVSV